VGFDVGRDDVQYAIFIQVAQGELPTAFATGGDDQRIGAKAAAAVTEENADAGLGDGNEVGLSVEIEVEKRQVPASVAHAERRRVCKPPVPRVEEDGGVIVVVVGEEGVGPSVAVEIPDRDKIDVVVAGLNG